MSNTEAILYIVLICALPIACLFVMFIIAHYAPIGHETPEGFVYDHRDND